MKAEEEIYRDNTLWSEVHSPLFLFLKYLKRGSVLFLDCQNKPDIQLLLCVCHR